MPGSISGAPGVAATQSGDTLRIIRVTQGDIPWGEVAVAGCTGVPTGPVSAGDQLTGCSGRVAMVYEGTLIFEQTLT
jgi:hypothetical protein